MSETQDQNKRKSVKVEKKAEQEETVTEQSKIGEPTSPHTVLSPYLKSSYHEISGSKRASIESNPALKSKPLAKKGKTSQSRDSKLIDHKYKSSTNVSVKE